MMNFTEAMQSLVVISCNTIYELTGYRYFDWLNMVYWYESSVGVWLLGDSMKYADGRTK